MKASGPSATASALQSELTWALASGLSEMSATALAGFGNGVGDVGDGVVGDGVGDGDGVVGDGVGEVGVGIVGGAFRS